jgi:hypothetical protein
MRTFGTSAWIVVGLLALGCRATPPPEPTEAELVRARGAVAELKQSLLGRLTPALQHGAVNAISVCSAEAPGIAAALSTEGLRVGRATRRPRNPAHAAAGWQLDALAGFESRAASGAPLAGISFAARRPDGAVVYAEPLVTQELCVACHGKDIAPDVRAALAERYPGDQATGYAVGELRGIAWAELRR